MFPLSQIPAPACLRNLCLGRHCCCWKPCPPQQGAVPPARPPSGGPGPGHPARPGWAWGPRGAEWRSWPPHPEPERLQRSREAPGLVTAECSTSPRWEHTDRAPQRDTQGAAQTAAPRPGGHAQWVGGTLRVSAPLLPRVTAASIDPEPQAPFPTAPERKDRDSASRGTPSTETEDAPGQSPHSAPDPGDPLTCVAFLNIRSLGLVKQRGPPRLPHTAKGMFSVPSMPPQGLVGCQVARGRAGLGTALGGVLGCAPLPGPHCPLAETSHSANTSTQLWKELQGTDLPSRNPPQLKVGPVGVVPTGDPGHTQPVPRLALPRVHPQVGVQEASVQDTPALS